MPNDPELSGIDSAWNLNFELIVDDDYFFYVCGDASKNGLKAKAQ